MTRVALLNGFFDPVTLNEAVVIMGDMIRDNRRGIVCTVNVSILMMMRSNPLLNRIVTNSALTVADGQPLIWAAKLFGKVLPERVTGVDLISAFAKLAAKNDYSIYLLGAEETVVQDVKVKLKSKFEGLRVVGVGNGYFSELEAGQRAAEVNASGADMLIVAMGVPRQEQFLDNYFAATNAKVALPVGGSFEVLAGRKKRAPMLMQRYGFEWLYRLVQEPGRLWQRYLVTNTQFILLLIVSLFRLSVRGIRRMLT